MPIPLRSGFDVSRVRHAARDSKDADQVRRLLALAAEPHHPISDDLQRHAADPGGLRACCSVIDSAAFNCAS
jgi:hypothetical protein